MERKFCTGLLCLSHDSSQCLKSASATEMSDQKRKWASWRLENKVMPMLLREEQGFVIAATGDSMISRQTSVYKKSAPVVQLIRRADIGFTNCETLFHNCESCPTAMGSIAGKDVRGTVHGKRTRMGGPRYGVAKQ